MNKKQSTPQTQLNWVKTNQRPFKAILGSKEGVNPRGLVYSKKADSPRNFWVILLILIFSMFLGLSIFAIFLGEIFNIFFK